MMSDLRELYQQLILDHNKNPRNFRVLDPADRFAKGYNPLCGDKVQIYLQLHGDRIKDIGFQGSGCAISKASASLMTETIKGKTLGETEIYFKDFHAMLTDPSSNLDLDQMGKLFVFAGVRDYPTRIKCATLSWHALRAAIDNVQTPITTER
ncbi:MAG: SUF system NifU family Fe-S cluster assembly protein [Gemmatimonadetes bacterium]|nr:SUF system NifU family Fe-S cluster assembly protein [Gemmatimonadota bacterium]MYF17535.1 SUF system NifU family Fe-S cluster assembly protein [Gemmatimonadota bacterium]